MAKDNLFKVITKEKLIPKEDCWHIKPLRDVIDAYPKEYEKIFLFCHYMKDLSSDNPYHLTDEDDKEEDILRELELDIDVDDPIIQEALLSVEKKYSGTFYKVFRGFKAAMERIGDQLFITQVDISKEGNSANIINIGKNYEQLRKSFKTAYKDFEEEQGSERARGGGEMSYDEDDD